MRYSLTPIYTRPWLLNGLSLRLIESHYENHYGGALRRLNAISEQLESLDFATTPPHVVTSLKREELIALNSTLLHELYFSSMAFGDGKPTETVAQALARDFGSVFAEAVTTPQRHAYASAISADPVSLAACVAPRGPMSAP